MATEPEPVSSDLSTALEQVEKESIENVKTIEKKPIADDGSPPGLVVNSSGPEETADDGDVVSDKESWNNDHVAEVDKGDVSGGSDGDGIKNEAVNKDMEKPKEETNKSEVAESEAEVNKAKTEKIEVPEPSESLDAAVVKEEDVQVEDSSEKIEVPESVHEVSNVEFEQVGPEVTEIIDVGKNEDLSEEKAARVIEELEKESSEPKAGDKIEVDATKDKESQTEPDPIGIEKPEELAHVEQRDRDFPPESEIDTESNRTEKVAMDEDNEVKKEDTVVNAKGISDFAETEQTCREIELPADLEGETLSTVDKDIEVEKKVDAEEPHKSETRTGGVEVAKKIDVEPVATEEAEAEQNATEVAKEEKGFKEETNETELPESGTEVVNEAKSGEVATKQNLEEIEPSSESLVVDDVAKESSQKIEILEPEQSEAAVMITEAKNMGNSAAKQVNNEDDLSNEKDETTKEMNKESAETNVADKFEIDATKDKESQANNKVEGFELKSESVVPEPPIATDESNVEEPRENIDDTEKLAVASRDIEVPTDIIEGKNDKDDIEVDKKINAEESLESETTETKREQHLSDENAGITKESKELVETESTEKFDIDAAKDEQKEVEENVKLDAPIEESDDVKSTEEAAPPKEEEVAPAVKQKQSNNLLSKVKQSLVKAKKAIIKKAPSKTPPTS